MIRAGQLRHSVQFFKKTEINTDHGKTSSYTDLVCIAKAKVESAEVDSGDDDASKFNHTLKITVRYNRSLHAEMQVEFKGQRFDIIHFDNVMYANKELSIKARLVQ